MTRSYARHLWLHQLAGFGYCSCGRASYGYIRTKADWRVHVDGKRKPTPLQKEPVMH